MTLDQFKQKTEEYLTNNVTAMLGSIQLTSNERAELKLELNRLADKERQAAEVFLKSKGIAAL